MYLYGLDCDVKVTIMWIKFEKKRKEYILIKGHFIHFLMILFEGSFICKHKDLKAMSHEQ